MCGRYAITLPPEAMANLFGSSDRPNLPPRYNVAPTQSVPMVAVGKAGDRRIVMARWGLRPGWMEKDPPTGPLFNARSETVAEKPSFRTAFARHRCLIPADGFYEWQREGKARIPHFIHRTDGTTAAFAGLWAQAPQPDAPPLISCTIVTTAAAPDFTALHDRFPVVLEPEAWGLWLDPATPPQVLHQLIRAPAPGVMRAYRVSDLVGKVANDGPELLHPVQALL